MADDYIDIHKIDKLYETKLKRIEQDKKLSSKNKEFMLNYLKDSELGKTIKKGQKRKIGSGRNLQAAGILSLMSKDWFKCDLDKVTDKQMEQFILDLDKGKIKSKIGKPYSSETKSNIKKFIRKFYKWLLGNGKHYPELVDWIDTSKKDAEIEAIPGLYDGVWQIVELIPDIRRKALIWAAFDSGMREGEILNARIKDVEKNSDGIYYLTCRHSKTKPRTVSLPYASKLLDRWLEQHPKKDDSTAQLWQTSRVMAYKTIKLYGKKAHNKNITFHMIRHTSATFWAPKLDRTTFCKRFGWSYNSSSPDRYIDFAKVTENKVVDIAKADQYTKISKELEEQRQHNITLQVQMAEMMKNQERQNKILESIQNEKKLSQKS